MKCEESWEHWKTFVGFGPTDEAILRELRPVALQYADEVMDELYARWLQFPELRHFFPDNSVLARVKALQRQYFISLTGGEYGAGYCTHRLRIGAVHKRIGLTPKWYMGAYSIYLELVLPRVLRAFEYNRVKQARAVTALTKLITLDQQLALTAYFGETTASPALSCRNAPAIHQGKVVEVGTDKLTMTDMAGKNQHSHEVATDAAITCEGKVCRLIDVKVGDMVTVTTDTKDGKTVATKIEAKKAGS